MITIVSGLPRSGTSMMMKMLKAGGMEVVVDNRRKADEDNPEGYYELEKVKQIKKEASWLDSTEGKVFKMVSMLLYDLPSDKTYKVIFMKRKMEEILASQKKMLERRGEDRAGADDEEMAKIFGKHLKEIESWLEKQENMEVLYISYNDVIKNPRENAQNVDRFLGNKLDPEKMVGVVDQSLYRRRK